jgi:hypothetical protein
MVTPDLVSEEDIAKLIIPDDLPDEEPTFKAYIEAKVYDKNGHLIQYHRQPMRSLTQYFLAFMSVALVGTFAVGSNNTAQSILVNALGLPSQASNSSNCAGILWDFSIQLGSGSQAFSLTLSGLAAPIVNGTGSGELAYIGKSVSYAGSYIFLSVTVQNFSGSTIDVTEIGLFGNVQIICGSCNATYNYNFLFSYDTFSSAISIPNGSLATFQITLTFSG